MRILCSLQSCFIEIKYQPDLSKHMTFSIFIPSGSLSSCLCLCQSNHCPLLSGICHCWWSVANVMPFSCLFSPVLSMLFVAFLRWSENKEKTQHIKNPDLTASCNVEKLLYMHTDDNRDRYNAIMNISNMEHITNHHKCGSVLYTHGTII